MSWNNSNSPNPYDDDEPTHIYQGAPGSSNLPSQNLGGPIEAENRKNYPFFKKLNTVSILLSSIHVFVFILVKLLGGLPELQSGSITFTVFLMDGILQMLLGVFIVLYDLFYVKRQIENYSLQYYAMDFILIGILGSIFVTGAGFYLAVKGIIMMFFSLTERTLFNWKYKRSFRDVLASVFNLFSILYGFSILFFYNPWLNPLESTPVLYFYIALVALIVDAAVLRPITKLKQINKIPLAIAIIKLVIGISACFFHFAGIFIAVNGAFLTMVLIFRDL